MAISTKKFLSKTFDYGVFLQTNWATPGTNTSNYDVIPYNAGVTIFDPDVRPELFNTSGQAGIHKEFERVFVDGKSGLPSVSFSMPADLHTIAPHLVGALFTATEEASSPFTKLITCGGIAGVIDFNGNDAKLHTIAMNEKASVDDMIILGNAIIGNLNLTWDFNSTGVARLLQMDGNWVGNEMTFEQNPSGTWSTTTLVPMGNTDVYTLDVLTADGVDLTAHNVRRFTFNVANNVRGDTATTSGKSEQFDVSPVYTSKIFMDYNPTTEKILKDFQDGATITARINSSISAGSTGDLRINCTGGILQKQPFGYSTDFAAIEMDVMWHSVSAATPITINLSDDEDWGYTAA